ncbi:MAG: type I DNA topoisomerase [Pseudomonadota bacterium]|jgi:DNA topoisomerase-1|nr:type I DNA topoisomerase [Pseudomonadota bacterium]
MSKNLVIVESPAKAKTIEKFLGKDFHVLASYGHVRDLVPKEGAVDTQHDFTMKYDLIERNQKHVQNIAKAARSAEALFLATDPDREGEAISWHLLELLKERHVVKDKPVYRVVFHEITKRAITEAIQNPKTLSTNLINAQQARRALDYLVGFNLSPLLWKKIRRGLSAGRVQSPALRMIAERELEIEQFVTREYWTIEALAETNNQGIKAKLAHFEGKKLDQFSIDNEKQAKQIQKTLIEKGDGKLLVAKVEKKQRKKYPAPPFITSTIQQEAARKLGFSTKKTMIVAQQLYEGIDIAGESTGLITYMRTDSVTLAQDALADIRQLIQSHFGSKDLPGQPRLFKTKSKNAQEAHEAIRPTSVSRMPDSLKRHISNDQFRLYDLIWKRTLACQMVHATIDTVAADLSCGAGNIFRATGSTVRTRGFMKVYQESLDNSKVDGDQETILPPMQEGDLIGLKEVLPIQHFTEPPHRFSEATLVKTLEEYGIGRPSTYSSIISTLQQRSYVMLEKKRFHPTDVGRIVNRFLTEHFNRYVDYNFTADLEDQLDAVARGEKQWVPLMKEFWDPFKTLIDNKEESVQRSDVTQEPINEKCPECQSQLSIRLGRNGRFIGCTNFPECKYTRNLNDDKESAEPEIIEGRTCPKCNSSLVIKSGRYGKFIGCSDYPSCRHIEPLEKPVDTDVACPDCNTGSILKRKSRNNKIFFSCSTFPDCQYAIWNPPIDEKCPECGWPILMIKTTKRRGSEKVCPQKDCGYATPYEGDLAHSTTQSATH